MVAPSLNVTVERARSPGAPSARSAIVARSTVLPELSAWPMYATSASSGVTVMVSGAVIASPSPSVTLTLPAYVPGAAVTVPASVHVRVCSPVSPTASDSPAGSPVAVAVSAEPAESASVASTTVPATASLYWTDAVGGHDVRRRLDRQVGVGEVEEHVPDRLDLDPGLVGDDVRHGHGRRAVVRRRRGEHLARGQADLHLRPR